MEKPRQKVHMELSAGGFYTHGVADKALCRLVQAASLRGTLGTLPLVLNVVYRQTIESIITIR